VIIFFIACAVAVISLFFVFKPVLRIRDTGSGAEMGEKSGSGSGMNNPDPISENLETVFWVKILKFFDAYPRSGMEKIRILDNIPYPQRNTGVSKRVS